MPVEKRQSLDWLVEALHTIPNIVASASHAGGLARPDSHIDIGLYYREASPFSVERVRSVAEGISVPGTTPVVTDFYGWGAWVNGGDGSTRPLAKSTFSIATSIRFNT